MGFADDYLKVVRKRRKGLVARYKLTGQLLLGLIVGVYIYHTQLNGVASEVEVPFLKDAVINLGILGRRIFTRRLVDCVAKADPAYTKEFLEEAVKIFADFETDYVADIVRLMEIYEKPVLGVSLLTDEKDATVYRVEGRDLKAVFYETPEQAVKAVARMVEYQRFRCNRTD